MAYSPTEREKEIIKKVYLDYEDMRNIRNNRWKYFNDRSLKDFIEDSQLRLSGYVPDKESQGKESWQSNVFHPITRNKFKAMLASVALDIPQVRVVAQNEKKMRDLGRAEIMKNLLKHSYDNENKEEQIFFEAWESAEKGTVIVYDGYLQQTAKRKIIKSYNPMTGEVETEEKEIETANECVNFIVPLLNLYIKDITIFDIQKQPSLCWVEHMSEDKFELEFGKYKKAKHVEESSPLTKPEENDTFYKEYWQDRITGEEPIEVIRYFNKPDDEYIIIANGVVIFESPLILGKKKKWYPFAKTVFELFSPEFFYGNSLPNTLMGEQDVINALYNMALDKTYKSMAPALLIGNTNKDDFDLEDQNTTIDTKIYVQDINQVKEMPISGIDNSDVQMIEMISRGLDLSSVDSNQQGVAGRGVTAREVVIANENAKKLKGAIYLFLTSLWIQKMKLRTMNILTYYMQPKVVSILGEKEGEENKLDQYQTFLVDNTELSSGAKGTLGVQVVGDKEELPDPEELDVMEESMKMTSGEEYELIAITSDYLDDWQYDIKIISDSIYQKESGLTQVKVEDKLRVMATYFPQMLMQNQDKLFKDTIIAYEDDVDDYEIGEQQQAPVPGMGTQSMPMPMSGAEQATAGTAGLPPIPPI